MTDAEKKRYLPQIAATLKYGRFWEEKRKLYIVLFAISAAIIFALYAMAIYYFGIVLSFDNVAQRIFVLIGTGAILILPSIIFLILILRNEIARKKILLWLDDAIETNAHSYLYSKTDAGNRKGRKIYKIKIKFKIDGKHISELSKDYQVGGGLPRGYSLFWKKYIDKGIKILYSPKYKEVMILK